MNPNATYDQVIYTSRRGMTFGDLSNDPLSNRQGDTYNQSCYPEEYFELLPYSINKEKIDAKIDGLQAGGSTSINEGVKWGAGLLDPAFVPVVTNLQVARVRPDDAGQNETYHDVDPTLTNIPAPYNDGDTLKVMVLMTDGQSDVSLNFSSAYTSGDSDLISVTYNAMAFSYAYDRFNISRRWYGDNEQWRCTQSRYRCVYEPTGPEQTSYFLYSPVRNNYVNLANDETYTGNNIVNMPGYVSHTAVSWPVAWGLMTPEYYGNKTGNWAPNNQYTTSSGTATTPAAKNTQLENICTASKRAGIVIYTIAFEMGDSATGTEKIRRCASSESHHFNAALTNITSAFNSIADDVVNLRLTQ
jgi:hypothetical protein